MELAYNVSFVITESHWSLLQIAQSWWEHVSSAFSICSWMEQSQLFQKHTLTWLSTWHNAITIERLSCYTAPSPVSSSSCMSTIALGTICLKTATHGVPPKWRCSFSSDSQQDTFIVALQTEWEPWCHILQILCPTAFRVKTWDVFHAHLRSSLETEGTPYNSMACYIKHHQHLSHCVAHDCFGKTSQLSMSSTYWPSTCHVA